jgi:hypothetical protein
MGTIHYCTREQFLQDIERYLDLVKPRDRVEIGKEVVLIHPKSLRFLDKCVDLIDDLPVGIESLIDEDEDEEDEEDN